MTVMFKTDKWSARIEVATLVKRTAKRITVIDPGMREPQTKAVHSEYSQYHDTFEDAKAYLLRTAETKVVQARNALQRANDFLGNVKGLKPKSDAPLQGHTASEAIQTKP